MREENGDPKTNKWQAMAGKSVVKPAGDTAVAGTKLVQPKVEKEEQTPAVQSNWPY